VLWVNDIPCTIDEENGNGIFAALHRALILVPLCAPQTMSDQSVQRRADVDSNGQRAKGQTLCCLRDVGNSAG
jgi:hypothetical protein